MSDTPNIYQRLHKACLAVGKVVKESPSGLQYKVVTHDAVTAAVRPHLNDAGIVYHPTNIQPFQNGNRTEVMLTLRFVNIDRPNDFIDVPSLGYGIDTQDKGPGKAISYAVKYALLKTLGLETGDDADLANDQNHVPDSNPGLPDGFTPIASSRPEYVRTVTTIWQTMDIAVAPHISPWNELADMPMADVQGALEGLPALKGLIRSSADLRSCTKAEKDAVGKLFTDIEGALKSRFENEEAA